MKQVGERLRYIHSISFSTIICAEIPPAVAMPPSSSVHLDLAPEMAPCNQFWAESNACVARSVADVGKRIAGGAARAGVAARIGKRERRADVRMVNADGNGMDVSGICVEYCLQLLK